MKIASKGLHIFAPAPGASDYHRNLQTGNLSTARAEERKEENQFKTICSFANCV